MPCLDTRTWGWYFWHVPERWYSLQLKNTCFLFLSFSLTYLDRWSSALIGRRDLHLTFHLGWFGNFRDFLPLFSLATPSWPFSISFFSFSRSIPQWCHWELYLTEISLPFTGSRDVPQLKWWEAKLCVVFFSWLLHCRWPLRSSWTTMLGWARPLTLMCISSSWCEPPGSSECMTWEQGTATAAMWLQMIKHQLKTRISTEFIFIPGFLRCLHTLHFLGQKK